MTTLLSKITYIIVSSALLSTSQGDASFMEYYLKNIIEIHIK